MAGGRSVAPGTSNSENRQVVASMAVRKTFEDSAAFCPSRLKPQSIPSTDTAAPELFGPEVPELSVNHFSPSLLYQSA